MAKGTHSIGIFSPVVENFLPLVDYGGPLHEYDIRIGCRKPRPTPAYFNLLKVYSARVWAMLLASLLGVMAAYGFISHVLCLNSRADNKAYLNFFVRDVYSVIAIQFAQSKYVIFINAHPQMYYYIWKK